MQLGGDAADILALALEREGGSTGSHSQSLSPQERGQDLVGDPLAQRVILGQAARVGERQHRQRSGRRLAHARGRRPQRIGERLERGEPVRRHLGQRLAQHLGHRRRRFRPHRRERRHGVRHLARHHGLRGGGGERRMARQHLVNRARQTVFVGPGVQLRLAGARLGTHVLRGADQEPRLRQRVFRPAHHRPRDAEVHERGVPLVKQHVVRLHVPVDHAVPVRALQALGQLTGGPQGLVQRQLHLAPQPVPQRGTLHVGHDVVHQRAGLARVEQREDMRVAETRRDADLAQEAIGPQAQRDLRAQHLERHWAIMFQIVGQVHGRGAAAPQLPLHRIPARERFSQRVQLQRTLPQSVFEYLLNRR